MFLTVEQHRIPSPSSFKLNLDFVCFSLFLNQKIFLFEWLTKFSSQEKAGIIKILQNLKDVFKMEPLTGKLSFAGKNNKVKFKMSRIVAKVDVLPNFGELEETVLVYVYHK